MHKGCVEARRMHKGGADAQRMHEGGVDAQGMHIFFSEERVITNTLQNARSAGFPGPIRRWDLGQLRPTDVVH